MYTFQIISFIFEIISGILLGSLIALFPDIILKNNKDILLFIAIIGVFILLIVVSPYLKFKLLMVTSIIFYPLSVFLYINQGLKLGLWLSFFNKGLFIITTGIITDVIIFLSYISENRKDVETPLTLIVAQFMSVSKLFLLAEIYQILLKK